MGRLRKPDALTAVERVQASRVRRKVQSSLELTADLADCLKASRERHGDATYAAVVWRLLRAAGEA